MRIYDSWERGCPWTKRHYQEIESFYQQFEAQLHEKDSSVQVNFALTNYQVPGTYNCVVRSPSLEKTLGVLYPVDGSGTLLYRGRNISFMEMSIRPVEERLYRAFTRFDFGSQLHKDLFIQKTQQIELQGNVKNSSFSHLWCVTQQVEYLKDLRASKLTEEYCTSAHDVPKPSMLKRLLYHFNLIK